MLISNLFVKHKQADPRLTPAIFLGSLAVFTLLGQSRPLLGLMGIGVTVIIAGILVELNRYTIWDTYRKSYKKEKGLKGLWVEPNRIYYNLNVYFLWPFVVFLGILCLYTAYWLS
jgi:hypothetical protein